jgi:tripartite ATP-independent transporter DctM subunit
MATVAVICLIKPELGGPRRVFPFPEMIKGLAELLPIILLFSVIIGSIYKGWATPTEAASVGVGGAFVIAIMFSGVTWKMIVDSVIGTVKVTSMIMLVVIGASFLNFTLSAAGLSGELRAFLEGLGLTPFYTLLVIVGMYVVLGFFIETLSLMVITIPIVVPIIVALGYDPIWFGILMIVLIEMALITPPVGLNLYVVQAARRTGSMSDVMLGALPFVAAMFVMVAALIAFPDIALYLPGALK